ncbi:MAG TPA: hypothetical protein VNJ02_18645 [Vicinamibacterales bacterium]|nr:hypothetical protein [Vicinamibacterales bacterium]
MSWTVQQEGGSEYIRDKVLRKALVAEAEALRTHEPQRSALTDANYNFFATDAVDPSTATIRVEPRRRDVLLVSGVVVVNRDDGDLLRVAGRLSMNPSFWTRSVDIVRHYRRVSGIRVPVLMESEADVRIAGRAAFRMTYAYEMINGQPVLSPAR